MACLCYFPSAGVQNMAVVGVSVAVVAVRVVLPRVGVPSALRRRPQAPGDGVEGAAEVRLCGGGSRHCVADQVGESGGGR